MADKTNPIPLDDGQLDEVAGGITQEDFSTYRYECRDCGTVFISEENRARRGERTQVPVLQSDHGVHRRHRVATW